MSNEHKAYVSVRWKGIGPGHRAVPDALGPD